MPKTGRYPMYCHFGLDEELHSALKAEAARRKLSVANLVRDMLRQGLAERAAADGRAALEEAIRRAMRPDVERLAKLCVRAAMEAGTAILLNYSVLEEVAKVDALSYYQAARKKSVARLRQPLEDEA